MSLSIPRIQQVKLWLVFNRVTVKVQVGIRCWNLHSECHCYNILLYFEVDSLETLGSIFHEIITGCLRMCLRMAWCLQKTASALMSASRCCCCLRRAMLMESELSATNFHLSLLIRKSWASNPKRDLAIIRPSSLLAKKSS